jgi:hypothetical protein
VLELRAADAPAALSQHERTSYVLFFTNVFASLEDEMVRAQALRLVSLPLWHALSPGRLQLELHGQPALAKRWKALLKKDAKAAKEAAKKGGGGEGEGGGGGGGEHVPAARRAEATFVPGLIDELLASLAAADEALAAAEVARAGGGAGGGGGGPEPMEVEGEVEGGAGAAEAEAEGEEEEGESSDEEQEEEEQEGADGQEAAAEEQAGEQADGEQQQHEQQQEQEQAQEPAAAANGVAAAKGAKGAKPRAAKKPRKPRGPRGPDRGLLLHVERCVELVIDLLSQLPTRRFVHAVLEDRAVAVKARLSGLYRWPRADRCGRGGLVYCRGDVGRGVTGPRV